MTKKNTRIVQLVPLTLPLWVIVAYDPDPDPNPDDQGRLFASEPVLSLALVEDWKAADWESDAGPTDDRERHIQPVGLIEGLYLDIITDDWLALTDVDPATPEARDGWNAQIRRTREEKARWRAQRAAAAKVSDVTVAP